MTKTTKPAVKKEYRTLSDILGAALHGTKISRGYHIQWAVSQKFHEMYRGCEILEEVKLKTDKFKSGGHKVDIIVIDHTAKTVDMFSIKSEGISNTDPKQLVGLPQMQDALHNAQERWDGYVVTFRILRTGGEPTPEWEAAGFHTISTSEFIGCDVLELVAEAFAKKLLENMERQIQIAGMTNTADIEWLMSTVPLLLKPIRR
jgi:hypothetical protein